MQDNAASHHLLEVANTASVEPSDEEAFKTAQWSPDGTCVLTNSGHGRGQLDTFVVPQDLLTGQQRHLLRPYASLKSAEPVYASIPYPYFDLAVPATTLLLSSVKDHPVQLRNALAYNNGTVATYPLISEKEDSITPTSLAFARDGSHFIAGSDRYLSVFDVSRNGDPAVEMHRTIPSRKALKAVGGMGINGVISSLSISSDGLLAAGTFNRAIGIYSSEGRGEGVSLFKLDERLDASGRRLHGTGITKLAWSPCGRYLYVAERRSDLVLAYDIRVTGTLLAILVGHNGDTNQRLAFDIVPERRGEGHEIWVGGTDGIVRAWRNPQQRTGDIAHDWQHVAHSDPVISSTLHPSGMVLATCAAPDRGRVVSASRQARRGSEGDSDSSRGSSPDGDDDIDTRHTEPASLSYLKLWSVS